MLCHRRRRRILDRIQNKMNEKHEWMKDAACRGCDTNLFFSERGDHSTMMTALEICNGTNDKPPCPVRKQCLDWANSHEDDNYGVFGGMAASARIKLRRQKRKTLGVEPVVEYKPYADKRTPPKSRRDKRDTLTDRPLPTNYEWRTGLVELVRLVHETMMDAENGRRATKGVGPVAIEIRE